MGDEDAEAEGAFEIFGVHRLPLAAGTKSGYVGVRFVVKSKKRPWQAWLHIKGERRRCLGSFRTPQEGAVARARAVACGAETLPSPRRQAARNSGVAECRPDARHHLLSHVALAYDSCVFIAFVLCAVKRSADGTLCDYDSENISRQLLATGVGCVPPSASALLAASGAYTPPYSAPTSVQTARWLLPGQSLPQGVVAFGMAMPVKQSQ